MAFWNNLNFTLKRNPKNPTEFVQRFIQDCKKSRVQLEIIREDQVLIQVDSLRYTPSWFKIFKIDPEEFKNGYAIFFILDQEELGKNQKYIELKKSDLELLEHDEMLENTPIKTFVKFIKQTNDPIKLGLEMKNIIDVIFKTNEKDPQALFNLRYLDVQG
ncbi:hypothetical protein [Christiangramia sp. OXR-203]|uniref:hypothetical protein n=1 Tax=Christiangramia sp. OXR-203 TaxID=3100176 RepID=UPI002AC9E53F|nr:hypothetical protein [Christiangramia sp. OXR-203]WPY97631.1 hypothetical protein T8I65_10640 [Christiangramia sp. OXR-203]